MSFPARRHGDGLAALAERAGRRTLRRGGFRQNSDIGSVGQCRPDWGGAFDDVGLQLAELAGPGTLTRGLRAVLAHHLLFLFNQHGVPAAGQYALARAARQGSSASRTGSGTARTAAVCPR